MKIINAGHKEYITRRIISEDKIRKSFELNEMTKKLFFLRKYCLDNVSMFSRSKCYLPLGLPTSAIFAHISPLKPKNPTV